MSKQFQAIDLSRMMRGLCFALAMFTGIGALQAVRAATASSTCAAVVAGNEGTVFSSADAQAVRDAVEAASAGGVVKIAGTCTGVVDTRVVGVNKALTLRGGYTTTNWLAAPNAVANPTVLDGAGAGRVITATAPITVENLTIQNGLGVLYIS